MLFNSYGFIFFFLPLSWLLFVAAGRIGKAKGAIAALIFTSMVFYGSWSAGYLLVLIALLLVNYTFGRWQERCWERRGSGSRMLLTAILALNLGVLGYFKYAHFAVGIAAATTGRPWSFPQVVLPLGISFFMFQKIAYQVDSYRGETRGYRLAEFVAFVMFFPQLIAGPIVYHREIFPQLRALSAPDGFRLCQGITLFSIGLFKKAVLADALAPAANGVFDAMAAGGGASFGGAWTGAIAYALQLYFDFSGYSDMAVGLGWMFGITLPFNFNSPYKASGIIDFWHRWHMTLSRFLKDYVYIPLGGNRCSPGRRHFNVMATMVLGGLWHGAGWTFILWGALHGAGLTINRAWQRATAGWKFRDWGAWPWIARGLTLWAVLAGWVLFRSADLASAGRLLAAMHRLPHDLDDIRSTLPFGYRREAHLLVLGIGAIALFGPNTLRLFSENGLPGDGVAAHPMAWRMSRTWALATGLLLFASIFSLTRPSDFLYYQF